MLGSDVLAELKKRSPFMPVIVVTAFGDEEVAVASFRSGATDYLRKPFKVPELLERIRFCLLHNAPSGFSKRDTDLGERSKNDACGILPLSYDSDKVQQAIRYIDENYPIKINRGEIADLLCISKSYFSRLFKKATGKSLPVYLNDRRIKKAKALLKREGVTVAEVALSTGYDDLTHFERVFKKATALTPSEYQTIPLATIIKSTKSRIK